MDLLVYFEHFDFIDVAYRHRRQDRQTQADADKHARRSKCFFIVLDKKPLEQMTIRFLDMRLSHLCKFLI